MTFSDGTSLSAEDVVYSLEQAKGKGSVSRERLSDVTSITASGSTTVVIEINAADAAFDLLLDIPIISRSGGSNPIGTGPYVLNTKKGKAVSSDPAVQIGGRRARCPPIPSPCTPPMTAT